ncbi:MAG: hypothetical protein N2689_16025, partial [Verrucomicrobiae bacterium]|nr:hypothetical protein [Verrucomicrobiae bacterium]
MNRRLANLMDRTILRLASRMISDGHSDHEDHSEHRQSWSAYPRDLGSWETLFALPETMPDVELGLGKPVWLGPASMRRFQFP